MKFTDLDPKECPYYLITRASLSITAEFKKAFADSGAEFVKPAYLGVLMCLWKDAVFDETLGKFGAPGAKLTDLGRCAGLEPSTMTGVIDRMERDGLVYRADDPGDRRAQNIHLTDRGCSVREAVISAINATLEGALRGIPGDTIETAKDLLRQVLINTNRGDMS